VYAEEHERGGTLNRAVTFQQSLAALKRWQPMLMLLQMLAAHEAVSDTEIEQIWDDFQGKLQTDCEAAASALMSALASICVRRPDMLEKLLPKALEPLWMLGIEDAGAVARWAIAFTAREEPYMGRPDADAIDWILEVFAGAQQIESALQYLIENDEI
jgi:hypothetical protein